MPTIAPVLTALTGFNVTMVSWPAILVTASATASNTGDAVEVAGRSDRSVQFDGTFDGATVVVEGSNDGTTYYTLTDPQGNSISKTAAGLEQIEEITRFIRPRVHTSTNGQTSINIMLLMKGERHG